MTFKKLDDLPKGRPATYDEVMKAMAELHKGVLKQAALYGGKNSKLFLPAVVETSLMKAITSPTEPTDLDSILQEASEICEALNEHLATQQDSKAQELLTALLRKISTANAT